jgi:hypothetical protein
MIPQDGNYCNEDIEMEDRELLQMAAKAYGVELWKFGKTSGGFINNRAESWSPLTNDGDAFRLALKLQIKIEYVPEMDSVMCSLPGSVGATSVATIGDVELRYAIVQAAAQLGLTMP